MERFRGRMLLAAGGLALLLGCGRDEPERVISDGETTLTQEADGDITVKGPEGETTLRTEQEGERVEVTSPDASLEANTAGTDISADELGLPFYPEATAITSATMDNPDGSSSKMVQLQTADPVKDVFSFYKGELGELTSETLADDKAFLIKVAGNVQDSISVLRNDDQSVITLTRVIRPE